MSLGENGGGGVCKGHRVVGVFRASSSKRGSEIV